MESTGKKQRPRRSFSPEFKAEIVELCQRGDRSVGQVARDFDLTLHSALMRLVPQSLGAVSVNAVTDREVTRTLVALTRDGLAESSVRRFGARCRRSSHGLCGNDQPLSAPSRHPR